MFKVWVWSIALNKGITHTFDDFKSANEFATLYNGIFVA